MTIVEFWEMSDKRSQQRRRRADGAVGPLLTEAQWKKIAPLLPRPPKQRKVAARGSTTVVSSNGFCGFCAAAGRVVEHLGRVPERVERVPAVAVERVVSGRQFCTGEKRGCGVGKPSGARGRSGWWWSTARVFLWETTFTLHPRRKSGSRRRRSRPSA